MASGDNLGNLYIGIEADDSDLAAQLDAAVSVAASAGAEIGSAFTEAAADTSAAFDAFTQAYEASAAAEQQAAAQMSEFVSAQEEWVSSGSAAASAAEETAAAFDAYFGAAGQAAAATEDLGDAAGDAAGPVEEAGGAAEHFSEAVEHAGDKVEELLPELLKLAGIALTLEGLKEAATEAFTAFAREERAGEALTALTGSARLAESEMAALRNEANRLALPIPQITEAAQKFVAAGIDIGRVNAALESAANASRATGNDFGTVANAIDRMALSGTASGRMLIQLGITSQQLGAALGVTGDEASKAFKALGDPEKRVDAIMAALQKFDGLAESTAGDLTGSWQRLANEAEVAFADIGRALEPLASEFIRWAEETVKNASWVADEWKKMSGGIVTDNESVIKLVGELALTCTGATGSVAALAIGLADLDNKFISLIRAKESAKKGEDDYNVSLLATEVTVRRNMEGHSDFIAKLDTLKASFSAAHISDQQYLQGMSALVLEFNKATGAIPAATAQVVSHAAATHVATTETKAFVIDMDAAKESAVQMGIA